METIAPNITASDIQEAALVGAVLKRGDLYESIRELINPAHFRWHPYGWAWSAFERLHGQGLRIDAITVGDELGRENHLDDFKLHNCGDTGRVALSKLRDEGDPRSVEAYAHKVIDYAGKRAQMDLFSKGAIWAANGRSADDIKNDIAKELELIPTWNGQTSRHTQSMSEAVSHAYDKVDAAARGLVSCVPTELIDLDKILGGGMYAPDFLILAGRPGQGKSALLTTIAKNTAERGKRPVIFSLEMSNEQVAQRMIAQESGVPTDRQRSGKLLDDEWPKYTAAVEAVAELPVIINDMPAISPSQIRQILRKIGEFDLIIVDYLQLGKSDERHEKRYLEVGAVSQGLKAIAKEFDKPVLAAAQMSRAIEQRSQGSRPVLSDLRESGSLEQDADVVMFLHNPDDETKKNITELIVAKQRNGATGSVELIYRAALTKFENAYKAKY